VLNGGDPVGKLVMKNGKPSAVISRQDIRKPIFTSAFPWFLTSIKKTGVYLQHSTSKK